MEEATGRSLRPMLLAMKSLASKIWLSSGPSQLCQSLEVALSSPSYLVHRIMAEGITLEGEVVKSRAPANVSLPPFK
jgi:hypothetical protein